MSSLEDSDFQNPLKKIFQTIGNKISIELSPNKSLNTDFLAELKPRFCSVIWRIKSEHDHLNDIENSSSLLTAGKLCQEGYNVILHIPGKHFTKEQVLRILKVAKSRGVRGILAIQGDVPYQKDDLVCDFKQASDFVKFIKSQFGDYFYVGVAGYPEKHPRCKSSEEDLAALKFKVEQGADFILTQGCFSSQYYLEFVRSCRSIGITVPIICGVFLPNIFKYGKIGGVTYPDGMAIIESEDDDDEQLKNTQMIIIKNMIGTLLNDDSVDGVHLFSLNDFELCKRLLSK